MAKALLNGLRRWWFSDWMDDRIGEYVNLLVDGLVADRMNGSVHKFVV